MRAEDEAISEAEWRNFRYMLFATHPSEAASLLESVDEARETASQPEGYEEWAGVISDEELFSEDFEYVPFSAEEVEGTIDLLRRFGVAVQ